MDVEQLLTSTRSVRKSLDLDAPVDADEIRDCLRIACQAANGTNMQTWRWIVVSDPELRAQIAELYRDSFRSMTGPSRAGDGPPRDTPFGRIMSSTEWLVDHLGEVPLHVIPCYEPYLAQRDDSSFWIATLYGSVFPAVWNFQLALHTRGYGTCITTLHLGREREVGALLGIPETYVQGCLLPVGRLRAGQQFGPAPRRPIEEVAVVDRFDGPVVTAADLDLAKVQKLVDRQEILDCLHRYARGMDRHDRELARSAYHDDAIDVHGSLAFAVDDFLDWAFAYHAEQLHHQHYLMNPTIEVNGDVAHAETYYLFVGRYPDRDTPLTMVGGRYVDRLDRRDGRWAIARRVCTAEWRTTPSSHLPDRGTPAVVPAIIVSQDRDDVSYVRPLAVRLAPTASEDDTERPIQGDGP